jgi:hypothetical protein
MSDRLFASMLAMLGPCPAYPDSPLILPQKWQDKRKLRPMLPSSVAYVLWKLYYKAKVEGAASRSCRQTFLVDALAEAAGAGVDPVAVGALAGVRDPRNLSGYRRLRRPSPTRPGRSAAVREVLRRLAEPAAAAYVPPRQLELGL